MPISIRTWRSGNLTYPKVLNNLLDTIGYDFSGVDIPKDNGLMSLRYSEFVIPLVKAVQEQQQLIINQQKTIDDIKKKNEQLEKDMQLIKTKLGINN